MSDSFQITYPRMPWWIPPHDAFWFDKVGTANITSASGVVTLIDFTVSNIDRGVIRWFGQAVQTPNKENLVTWNILINNAPDKVYGSIVGLISTIILPTETLIKLPKGSHIQLQVSTADTSSISVVGRFKGWTWLNKEII